MHKIAATFIASVLLGSLCYLCVGIWLVTSRERQGEVQVDKWDPYHTYMNTVNATMPPVGGAIRYYVSLLDNEAVTLRCSSCALVSSSGFLLGKGAGPAIDDHQCVIRMNMAPVEGYQRDVGKRTTLRVMNFFMLGLKPEELPVDSRVMVWGLFRRSLYLKKAQNFTEKFRTGSSFHGQTVEGEAKASALFTKETGQPLGGTNSWLSTGWFTLMVAIDICQEIHVYGMVTSDHCKLTSQKDFPYHYYQSHHLKSSGGECATYRRAEVNKKGAHRFMTEKAVFARWALRYNISFHYPEWRLYQKRSMTKLDTPFLKNLGRMPR